MKPPIVGIIAEYNPYHNGHLYQMRRAKEMTSARYCVVVLSGHFMQRGEPALYAPADRARMALLNGADAVFEMPAPFSCASAKDYALYGISLLGSLGIPFISCGTEKASAEEILAVAARLNGESDAYRNALRFGLKNGLTFPEARLKAIAADLSCSGADDGFIQRSQDILSTPNNILATEYAKAVLSLHSPLKLVTVDRQGSGYGETELGGFFSSARSVRCHILCGRETKDLETCIPAASFPVLSEAHPVPTDAFTGCIIRKIIDCLYEGKSFDSYADTGKDLANRIAASAHCAPSYEALVTSLKTRDVTYTHVARSLMHIFLGITKESMQIYKSGRVAPYARLIGFRESSADLLGILKENTSVPMISKMADASSVLDKNMAALSLLLEEVHAASLWNSVYYDCYREELPNLYEQQMVIV